MQRFLMIDEERAQSRARMVICWLSLVGFLGMNYFESLQGRGILSWGLVTVVGYLAFATAWYLMVRRYPGKAPWRRNVSLVADLTIMTVWFQMGGGEVATYYPIFLWVIIGNGIRFGEKYLLRGIVVGATGFGSVLVFNPYWHANFEVGLGLLLGVLVLPIFYQGALRRLRLMNDLKVELAKSRLAEKAKDRFLATMSHELRTPLNGVLGMAESLRASDLDRDQRTQLDIMSRSVEALLHTISDILDYSGLAGDEVDLTTQEFDLRAVVSDVECLLRTPAEERGLDLELDYPEGQEQFFKGDSARIRQVVFHVTANAVKFTEKGGVRLAVRTYRKGESHQVRLTVEDTGIGIPADRLEAVLKGFQQVDNSTTRKNDGVGLGLGLTKRLVDLMGGDLEVKSRVGKGTTVTVTLTLEEGSAPVPVRNESPGSLRSFGITGLVVEDNKFNQAVLVRLLKMIGIDSEVAANGAEALEKLERGAFDIIFMDVRMPVMNGYDATLRIRQREAGENHIPIIAVTADVTRNVEQQCRKVGMDAFLDKPVTVNKLVAAIEGVGAACSPREGAPV